MTNQGLQPDFFQKKLNKKQQVYEFIKRRGRVRTSEVAAFGVSIYHPDRACRDARDLADEGKIWRVKKVVMDIIAPKSREKIWSTLEGDR